MIIGVGIDLVEIPRIERAWKQFGRRFTDRLLVAPEAEYCLSQANPAPSIAARFAAKEAVAKAFGVGIGGSLGWHDIEVRRRETGEPFIVLGGKGHALMAARQCAAMHLSLSHTAANAIAVAILERDA